MALETYEYKREEILRGTCLEPVELLAKLTIAMFSLGGIMPCGNISNCSVDK